MSSTRLTKRTVEAVSLSNKDIILRDSEIKGFLCKVTPKGRRVYMLNYRTKDGQERRPSIGVHGEITCDQARGIAQDWKALIAKGGDPSADKRSSRQSPTIAELCDRYMHEYAAGRKKASSLRNDDQMIRRFILPAIGARKVSSITTDDINRIHNQLRPTPYQANRVLALLSKMFSLAEAWNVIAQGSNPTKYVEKFPEEKRERYLNTEELERLGAMLNEAEADGSEQPEVIAAIKLLLMTGCRLGEVLNLRWDEVMWEQGLLRLPETKTGSQFRPVGKAVLSYLESLPWKDELEHVIPGRDKTKPLVNLSKPWGRIRDRAGLSDVRIHDLRHTHASAAAGSGLSLPIIGRLLGHTQASTTQRYAHLANDPVSEAADNVSNRISSILDGSTGRIRRGRAEPAN